MAEKEIRTDNVLRALRVAKAAPQQIKVAVVLMENPLARQCLNVLVVAYWKRYDNWAGEEEKVQFLTPVNSIIRSRRAIVERFPELDWDEPVAKKLSLRGKGETEAAPFEEGELL